jgi:hypothetical protein
MLPGMPSTEIDLPTPGRVVLYAPDKSDDSIRASAMFGGTDGPEYQVLPATVLRHDGEGRVHLAVNGLPGGVFPARYGDAGGEPPVGCWCYPPRSSVRIPVVNAATQD